MCSIRREEAQLNKAEQVFFAAQLPSLSRLTSDVFYQILDFRILLQHASKGVISAGHLRNCSGQENKWLKGLSMQSKRGTNRIFSGRILSSIQGNEIS